jgi:hypothetical protein
VSATFSEWVFDRLTVWASLQASLVTVHHVQVAGVPRVDPSTGVGRYLVVQPINKRRTAGAVDGASRDMSATVQVTSTAWFNNSAASPAVAADRLADAAENEILDVVPDVDGWSGTCPVQQVFRQDGRPDESTSDRKLIYSVGQYQVMADRIS